MRDVDRVSPLSRGQRCGRWISAVAVGVGIIGTVAACAGGSNTRAGSGPGVVASSERGTSSAVEATPTATPTPKQPASATALPAGLSRSSSVKVEATSKVPIATTAPAPPDASTTSLPIAVSIPRIGVASSLQALGLEKDGTLQSPTQWQQAGWYARGTRPGDVGPAVIAGHVDSVSGPAVFFRLRELQVGDIALVKQQDGHTLRFMVDSVKEYPKSEFPTDAVYGPVPLAELRLITCTGDFDREAHSYVDNLVVSSHLVT